MKPILMNTEMVKAILAGTKNVTRRLIKPQPYNVLYDGELQQGEVEDGDVLLALTKDSKTEMVIPPYQPCDVLYVRETYASAAFFAMERDYLYKADDEEMLITNGFEVKWRPSIHMPKEAARIFLRVTDVRVERLQDITPDDIWNKEGIPFGHCIVPYDGFERLWNSTIKKSDLDKYGWEANPWVWVIGFERISREEANK